MRQPALDFRPLWEEAIKPSLRFVFEYSGGRFLLSKLVGARTNDPDFRNPPSLLLWLLGVHFAVFGIARELHENSIANYEWLYAEFPYTVGQASSMIEARMTTLASDLSDQELSDLNQFAADFRYMDTWCETAEFLEQPPKFYFKPDWRDPALIWKFISGHREKQFARWMFEPSFQSTTASLMQDGRLRECLGEIDPDHPGLRRMLEGALTEEVGESGRELESCLIDMAFARCEDGRRSTLRWLEALRSVEPNQ